MVMQRARVSQAISIRETFYDSPPSWYHPVKIMEIRSLNAEMRICLPMSSYYFRKAAPASVGGQSSREISKSVAFLVRAAPSRTLLFLPMSTIVSKC
jgi:hypothetical protein